MTFLLIVIAVFIVSTWLAIAADNSYKFDSFFPPLVFIAVISGVMAGGMLISIPLSRNQSAKNIHALEATRRTVVESRKKDIDPLERATLTREVIEWNTWLANEKYDNTHLWDIYTVDEVMNVKPIE